MRYYTVVFNSVAVAAQQDLWQLTGAASRVAALHSFELAQVGTRDEPWAILIKRNTGGTSGSGGTSPTPQPTMVGTAAAATTAMVNNTTKMSAGTPTTLYSTAWSIRQPTQWIFTPEMRLYISGTERLTIELATTPGASTTVSGTLVFEGIG